MESRTQGDPASFPAWYYRVTRIEELYGRDACSADFDEDLSELEDREQSDGEDEEVDPSSGSESAYSDCERGLEGNDSEKSSDGPEAKHYYELKRDRESRKRSVLRERREEKKNNQSEMAYEKAKEDEVHAAYKSFEIADEARRTGETIPLNSSMDPFGQTFRLNSTDYIKCHFFSDPPTKYVEFYNLDHGISGVQGDENATSGHVYLNDHFDCHFAPFRFPTHASQKAVKMKSTNGEFDLSFTFWNGYLKLSMTGCFVKSGRGSKSAPSETFEFAGIWRNREKEIRDRRAALEKAV